MAITIKSLLLLQLRRTSHLRKLLQVFLSGYSPSLPIMNGAIRWITHINVRVHVVAIICIFNIHPFFVGSLFVMALKA
jgi:hypothetical protein